MYTRPRRTSLIQAVLSLWNVCWWQPPPVRSATKVQVVSQIHWAYSSPPSTLQSVVYTRFTAAYRDIGREKSEQISRPIYYRPIYTPFRYIGRPLYIYIYIYIYIYVYIYIRVILKNKSRCFFNGTLSFSYIARVMNKCKIFILID